MTPPNRGRRRRRRGGQNQQPNANLEQNEAQRSEMTGDNEVSAQSREGRQRRRDTTQQPDQQFGDGGARKKSRSRRRPNRQPMIGPMPTEVLKAPFRQARPTHEMERLQLDEVLAGEEDEVQFGCPMLTRTRLALPSSGNLPSPRCSMGWALHSEQEVALCLRTPDLLDCWKLDAQREERLREELSQDSAAD